MDQPSFVLEIAARRKVSNKHLLVQYLERKTLAVDRGSKARRSLGNLYALLVLTEDYVAGRTSRFTDLLRRMKQRPYGSKLQNHPLDNRLNDEFGRLTNVPDSLLPVQEGAAEEQKSRRISEELLKYEGSDPMTVAKFVVETIETYIQMITDKQSDILSEISEISTQAELLTFLHNAFAPNSDARLFEIASYVVLAEHFRSQSVFFGATAQDVKAFPLELFRTGRTNANDGGIDFVLKPVGRFFQVTETIDFGKYFLDFEKTNRYKISFVVKFTGNGEGIRERIRADALKSGRVQANNVDVYISLIEEIFTLDDLIAMANRIKDEGIERVSNMMFQQFKLEYGLLDE